MAELPGLWRGAQLIAAAEMQDDDARGGQTFVSLRIRIPLGGEREPRRLNFQERRMTAPSVRDVDVVTRTRTVARPALVETATLENGRPLAVLSSATTADLPGAVAAAGANSTVLLSGTFNTTATTALQPGQTLMGAGMLTIRTPSGYTTTLTSPGATIAASQIYVPVQMASNSVLTGLNVSNSYAGTGIEFVRGVFIPQTVSNATISGNTISVTAPNAVAVGIAMFGGLNQTITNNTITATSPLTGTAFVNNARSASSFTLSGNVLNGSTFHTSVQATPSTLNILPGSTGNTVIGPAGCDPGSATSGSIGYTNAPNCP
jgi:hypothetical protein